MEPVANRVFHDDERMKMKSTLLCNVDVASAAFQRYRHTATGVFEWPLLVSRKGECSDVTVTPIRLRGAFAEFLELICISTLTVP